MSNQTPNVTCHLSARALEAANSFDIFTYRILAPSFFFVGISTNILLLVAFYVQSKTEKAYAYQIIFTVSKIGEICAFATFLIMEKWFYLDRMIWFVNSYFLMRLYGVLAGFHMAMIICSQLLCVSMAADRVFALAKPFVYKNINHKRHQVVATVLCFSIGVSLTWEVMIYRKVVPAAVGVQGLYSRYSDVSIYTTMWFTFLFDFMSFARVAFAVLLMVLNYVMIHQFRKRMNNKVVAIANRDGREHIRKAKDKQLLWINGYQCCVTFVSQVPHDCWNLATFLLVNQDFNHCEGLFMGATCDSIAMLTGMADFFVMMALNGQMRKMVKNGLNNFKVHVSSLAG